MAIPSRISLLLFVLLMAGQTVDAQLDDTDMAADLAEAFTFTKYPTYFQYDSMMHQLAAGHPEICSIDTFGYSRQGRLLLALKISDHVRRTEDEPAFFYTGTMHGDELIGYVLLLRFSDFLLNNYMLDTEVTTLVNNVEIWINPLSNPDETFYPDDNYSVAYSRRPNTDILDLNRNFPDPEQGDKNDTTGRQQEIQHMMDFMTKHQFNMSANIHAGDEVVNYPWDHKSERHPDTDWFRFISREYADLAHDVNPAYMNGFTDGITNGADWYVIHGGRQDYTCYYLEGRELTLELSQVKKLPSEQLDTYWTYNQWSLFNLVSQASYGIHGKVVDADTGDPIYARVEVLEHDNDSSMIHSDSIHGSFFRYLKEGSYSLVLTAGAYKSDTIRDVSVVDFQATDLMVEMEKLEETGIATGRIAPGLRLFPNPAGDFVQVELSGQGAAISAVQVYSAQGRLLSHIHTGKSPAVTLDLGPYTNGLYFLKILGTECSHHRSLLIAR